MKKYVLTCDMPGAISILPPTGRLARIHPKYFFLGFSAALAPKFHPFHPGAPTPETPRAQRSRAPGRDLEAQAWIWRPRHGFRVPGMDLEAQAWIWRPGHGFGGPIWIRPEFRVLGLGYSCSMMIISARLICPQAGLGGVLNHPTSTIHMMSLRVSCACCGSGWG